MRTTIRKWGNSLGLRIPSAFSRELGIGEATNVVLSIAKSSLIVKLEPAPRPDLKKLLAAINESNLHAAVETGAAVGNEVW